MEPLFATVISASLARDAQRAALLDPPEPPERRGRGWLLRAIFGPPAEATGVERPAPAPAC